MAGPREEGGNHPARELRGSLVFLLRSLSPALTRETYSSRVSHIAATRTGPPHERGEPGGHASETRAAEGEEDDDDDDEERRGGSGDGGRGRLRWLYVAPNLSRGNYCVRNCRSERNPYVARRTRHRIGL